MRTTLGRLILSTRKARKVSARWVCTQVGVTPSYMSDIELDRRIPAEEVLRKIASVLELDFETVMALAGRLGEETEWYLKDHPKGITLMRTIAEENLSDFQIETLINEVEEWSRRKE